MVLGGGGLVFLATGLGGVFVGLRRRRGRTAAYDRAEPVEATVIESSIREETRQTSGEAAGTTTVYRPVVRFRYEYDGRTHESDLWGPDREGPAQRDESAAGRDADAYPEGETVTAFVDPERPGRGFLEGEADGDPRSLWDSVYLGVGAVLSLFGLLLCLAAAAGIP